MTSDVSHRCLSGSQCAAAEVLVEGDKKTRQPAPTGVQNSLCEPCIRRVRNACEDLPADYVALHVALGEQGSQQGARVKSSRSLPLPIDKHKYALMEAISANLDTAAELVSDQLHCDPPEGKVGHRIEAAARMVSTNLPKLLAAGEIDGWEWQRCDSRCGRNGCDLGEHLRLGEVTGTQLAKTLLDLHKRARAAIGETEKLIRLPMPCGSCGASFCFQRPDSDTVFCKSCTADWTEELYAFAGQLSRERKAEMELKERTEAWLAAEQLWLRAQAAEQRLAKVQTIASWNPDDLDGYDVATFINLLKEITGAAA
jgi:hypothetical protein